MAAGKPVIGVSQGGLLETIDDKRLGSLLDCPIDIEVFKQTIVDYAVSTDTQTDVHFRQQSVKRFDFSQFIGQLKQYIT
jgi:glycosyltransferase involved in cell wall biosynthesis